MQLGRAFVPLAAFAARALVAAELTARCPLVATAAFFARGVSAGLAVLARQRIEPGPARGGGGTAVGKALVADVLIARLAVAALPAGDPAAAGARDLGLAAIAATARCAPAHAAGIAFFAPGVLLHFRRAAAGRSGQAGGLGGEVLGQRHRARLHPGQPLDVAQIGLLIGRAEAQRDAIGPGPRGAADPVDVLFGHVGQLEVEHVADALDVDPARGDVGRDQHRHVALAERAERGGALGLALVAVDRGGAHPGGVEVAHHPVGTMLGPGKDQRGNDLARCQPLLQAHAQQRLLLALVEEADILLDPLGGGRLRGHLDPHRVMDELLA